MAGRAIIDQFPVAVYAEDRRIGYSGSDLRPRIPGVEAGSNASGLFGNQVRAGRPVTAEQDMQIIILVCPYHRTVMVVAACRPERDYFGESAANRIISDCHRFGGGLRLGPGLPPAIENNMNLAVEIDRLRPLPAVVEHLNLPALPKRHW